MRIQLACLLLVLLSATELSALSFKDKHLNKDMTPAKCDEKMKAINVGNKKCKKINTFILEDEEKVNAVCKLGEDNKIITSTTTFRVVKCSTTDTDVKNCKYEGKAVTALMIRLICRGGVPVHYDKPTDWADQ